MLDRRFVVTGATGYLGSSLVPRLLSLGAKVVLVSRRPSADILSCFPGEKNCEAVTIGSNPDWSGILAEADGVFHLAGQTSVGVSERDPLLDQQVNLGLTLDILRSAAKIPVVIAGTATVVGPNPTLPVPDGATPRPVTVYDLHKSMVESYVEYFARERGQPVVCLRIANVYGPGKTPQMSDRGVFQKIAKMALAGEKISVFGTGEYLRDFVYIDDVIDAFVAAWQNAGALAGKACFICGGEGRKIRDAFTELANAAGRGSPVLVDSQAAMHAIDRRNFVGKPDFLKSVGWRPKVSFAEGVDLTLKGLKA